MEFRQEHADALKEAAEGVGQLTAIVPGIKEMLTDHEERLRTRENEAIEVRVKQERMGRDLSGAFTRVRDVGDELDTCKQTHTAEALKKAVTEKADVKQGIKYHIQFLFMLIGAGGTVVGIIYMVAGK